MCLDKPVVGSALDNWHRLSWVEAQAHTCAGNWQFHGWQTHFCKECCCRRPVPNWGLAIFHSYLGLASDKIRFIFSEFSFTAQMFETEVCWCSGWPSPASAVERISRLRQLSERLHSVRYIIARGGEGCGYLPLVVRGLLSVGATGATCCRCYIAICWCYMLLVRPVRVDSSAAFPQVSVSSRSRNTASSLIPRYILPSVGYKTKPRVLEPSVKRSINTKIMFSKNPLFISIWMSKNFNIFLYQYFQTWLYQYWYWAPMRYFYIFEKIQRFQVCQILAFSGPTRRSWDARPEEAGVAGEGVWQGTL